MADAPTHRPVFLYLEKHRAELVNFQLTKLKNKIDTDDLVEKLDLKSILSTSGVDAPYNTTKEKRVNTLGLRGGDSRCLVEEASTIEG